MNIFNKFWIRFTLTKVILFILFNETLSKLSQQAFVNSSNWRNYKGSKIYSSHIYSPKVKNFIESAVVLCDSNSIGIKLDIFNFNGGRIFPSRHEGITKCTSSYSQDTSTITYRLPLNSTDCGVWSIKKSDKFLSVEYTITIIVGFNLQKLTEDDKLYNLKCVYNSMHQTLNALMEISTFSKTNLIKEEGIPDCHYSLHKNSIDGPFIGKVSVGEKVFHTWKCNNPSFAMKVYQCYVHDGSKKKYLIVDETGCSKDTSILPDLVYSSSLNLVFSEAKVFKFAHSSQIHFSCLILLCPKVDPNCKRYTPPSCPNTFTNNNNVRLRRAHTMNGIVEGNYSVFDDGEKIKNNSEKVKCNSLSSNTLLIISMLCNITTLLVLSVSMIYNWKHKFMGKIEISNGQTQGTTGGVTASN